MERFLNYFKPEKYNLDIFIDKDKKIISGVVIVSGQVLNETVKFHAVNLEITGVLVNRKEAKFKADGEVLEIFEVELGEADIIIYYNGKLNENMEGAYLSTYEYKGKKEIIVATQFESHYAREAFPCIDEPAAKAVFKLSISVPEGSDDLVLSNMSELKFSSGPRRSRPSPRGERANSPTGALRNAPNQTLVSDYKTKLFEPTPRMSTYLLAWVIGKFHGKTVKNKHGVEITTYCALNQDVDSVDFANEVAARSLEFYDDNFGEPYPLKKLDQVALPDFEAGAMENWGLVTYRESMLLVSRNATLGTKKSVALTVAHELSHQWFGDLVTMKWWDDLWLNESFASVMEYYAVDKIHPEYRIFEGFFTGDAYAALLRDAYNGVQSVHQEVHDPAEIATLFDGAIVYAKGARLMLMLIRLMGWNNFCKGLVDYFNKYQYKNTVGDDLWNSLKPYAKFDPGELMHAFIDKPGYPVITNLGKNFEKFSQKRFLLDGSMEDSDWPLPEITEDMSGHYVLNLSEEEFSQRLNDFNKLGLEEKLRLLIDRDLVTKSGLQSAASLIPLARRFKEESAPAVWNKIAALIANLKIYFDDESEEEKLLKKYVFNLVDRRLDEVGLATKQNDDEDRIRLRANLLALDYYAEDKKRLKKLAEKYRENYTEMDKEIRDDILSAKIYLEPEMTDEYLEKYKLIVDPEVKFDYLVAACLVKDEKQLEKVLALLGDIKIVKPQDQLHLFIYLYRNPKSKKRAFEWLTKNWDLVKKMGGEKTLNDYPMLVARLARTEEELEKFKEFFDPMRGDLALKRAIEIGKNEIRARVELIQKNKNAVEQELRKNSTV
ncbi:M1 family metallopeptidase [Candidatus Saccharibacteria bacterium]|nr:M1 family metallopeptidase [Candidatus Saccharibacteria bacterium]